MCFLLCLMYLPILLSFSFNRHQPYFALKTLYDFFIKQMSTFLLCISHVWIMHLPSCFPSLLCSFELGARGEYL